MKRLDMKAEKGFTLFEIMMVVVIIAIISAIALPSYQQSVRKTNRADAKVSLMSKAAELERCFTVNGQYTATEVPAKTCATTTTVANPAAEAALADTDSEKGKYTLGGVINATTFTLTATPLEADANCNVFTLTNTGGKSANGTDGDAKCWN